IGVETKFCVVSVLKGKHQGEKLTLFHFRERLPSEGGPLEWVNGPLLASFSEEKARKRDYLLYLKKRPDGRYECVSGQVDSLFSAWTMSNPMLPPPVGGDKKPSAKQPKTCDQQSADDKEKQIGEIVITTPERAAYTKVFDARDLIGNSSSCAPIS